MVQPSDDAQDGDVPISISDVLVPRLAETEPETSKEPSPSKPPKKSRKTAPKGRGTAIVKEDKCQEARSSKSKADTLLTEASEDLRAEDTEAASAGWDRSNVASHTDPQDKAAKGPAAEADTASHTADLPGKDESGPTAEAGADGSAHGNADSRTDPQPTEAKAQQAKDMKMVRVQIVSVDSGGAKGTAASDADVATTAEAVAPHADSQAKATAAKNAEVSSEVLAAAYETWLQDVDVEGRCLTDEAAERLNLGGSSEVKVRRGTEVAAGRYYIEDTSGKGSLFNREVDIDPEVDLEPVAEATAREKRIKRLLVALLRGEGAHFTVMVGGLLKEVEECRSERLRERMRTILGSYDCEARRAQKALLKLNDPQQKSKRTSLLKSADKETERSDIDSFNLKFQNMLYAPEVQTSLRKMRIPAPLACEPMVLAAVAETANEETLATDAVEALTAAAWLQLRAGTALDSFLCMVALACLCLVTWRCRYGDMEIQPALWTVTVIQGKEAIEWLAQVWSFVWFRVSQYMGWQQGVQEGQKEEHIGGKLRPVECEVDTPAPSLETVADLVFLVTGYAAIFVQMDRCGDRELDQLFLPWFCAMYWLRLGYSLRGERWLGPYLLPILSAVRDTGAFFFVTSVCVAASTHAYVILNARGDDPFPVYAAFTHTVRLAIFGDFDMFEYQGQDPTYTYAENGTENGTGAWEPNDPDPRELGTLTYMYLQLCFFCTGVGVAVLLMNLLIGILGQNYEIHQDRAQVLFVQARARMLLEQQRRPWVRMANWLHRMVMDLRPGHQENCGCSDMQSRPFLSPCWLGEKALIFLWPIMQPLHPRDSKDISYHQQNIFQRSMQRALEQPIKNALCRRLVIPVMFLFLLPASLVSLLSLLVFAVSCLLLKMIGGQVKGLRYFINLSIFGLFGDHFADECEIFALVRKEPGMDELRGMRSDLKEKMQSLEKQCKEQKEMLTEMLTKMESSNQHMCKKIDLLLAAQKFANHCGLKEGGSHDAKAASRPEEADGVAQGQSLRTTVA